MNNGSTPNNYLLVPINIEALVVGAAAGLWSDLHPDFSMLYGGRILGSQIAPALFDARPQVVGTPPDTEPQGPQPGIHLHWALPDALTHGRQKRPAKPEAPLEAPEFSLIPNRWMVQRISRKPQSNEISVRAWVVESDYLYGTDGETKEDAVTLPRPEAGALFDYVGKRFDYTSWSEGHTSYRIPLTALGYGDPAFAAYYPACKSILGFYDPLTDIDKETTFAYLVAGWYSDPAEDILRHFKMKELKWTGASASSPPTQLLCHGTIYNVQWKNRTFTYATSVPTVDEKNRVIDVIDKGSTEAVDRYQIALGNTATEALAALLAQQLDSPKIEPLLVAFQEGQLVQKTGGQTAGGGKAEDHLQRRDADLPELEFSLHQQRFGSLAGGRDFGIQKKDARQDQPLSATDVTLPESLEQGLAELNALEREWERRHREWDGWRWELYAMWHQWAKQYIGSDPRQEPAEITGKIKDLKQKVDDRGTELTTLEGQRVAKEQAVRNMVEQQFAELEFLSSPAAPFWLANDPVLLISGPRLVPSQRHGQDGRYSKEDELHCRVTGQELSSLIVDIPNDKAGVRVDAAEVFTIAGNPFAGGGLVPKGITDALLLEALLLDPANAEDIAERAYVNAKLSTRPEKDRLIGRIKRLQRPLTWTPEAAAGGSSTGYGGTFPSPIALRDWERNPWLPLFVEWQIAWYPSYTSLSNPLDHWQLGAEDVDFGWTGSSPDLNRSHIYSGYAILSPHAIEQFKERLRKYNEDKPDQDLSPVITLLNQMPVLAQALGGLNNAFIMRDQCPQIVPINPAIFAGKKESRRDSIIDRVKGANYVSPDPDKPFLPIRAGHLKVLALSIVDAFGQTLPLRTPMDTPYFDRPARAASLLAEGPNTEPLLRFAPRLAQPLRLRFEWSPTLNPPGTYPANSPVCGWVIPNHLDKNLTFYDGRGTALGALQKILRISAAGGTGGIAHKGDKAFFWVPMPRPPQAWLLRGTTHQPEDILNPHLKHFVQFLRNMDADTGNAFWNLLDEVLARTDPGEPEDDPLLSLLLGRPLALVRAELGLELAGLPASDQGLNAIGNFDSHGFTKVKFPVQLGEARNDTDGLTGYFTDAPEADSAGAFYPAAGATGTAYGGAIEYGHSLALDCETPLTVTLLMDPRAKVHAITGLLPKKAITLPPRLSSAAKSAKEAFFQVAPLVSPGGAISMPKPSDDFGKWSWAYRPQVTEWIEVETLSRTADQAGFAPQPQQLSEGWLKLRMNPLAILNFWVKEGTLAVQANTNITLGWTLVGGNRVSLAASEDGQEPRELKAWTSSPFPDQCQVHVQARTTYALVLEDKDGNRSEKRLTVALKGG
jgi:hypothetical protein